MNSFMSLFLAYRSFVVQQAFFFPYSLLPLVQAGRQCFCQCNILRNLVGLLCMWWGFPPLENRLLCMFSLDNPISISGLWWDGRGESESNMLWFLKEPSVQCHTWGFDPFTALEKGSSATPLACFPQHAFLTVTLLILASLPSTDPEIIKSRLLYV